MTAKLEGVVGSMFAKKSSWLLDQIDRERQARKRILAIKPKRDDRDGSHICAWDWNEDMTEFRVVRKFPAIQIETRAEFDELIRKRFPQVIFADEAQFFGAPKVSDPPGAPFDEWFYDAIYDLLISGRDVKIVIAGLNMDYNGRPFGLMPKLMAMGEFQVIKPVCFHCKERDATMSQRLSRSRELIQTGKMGDYEARCRTCWTPFIEE